MHVYANSATIMMVCKLKLSWLSGILFDEPEQPEPNNIKVGVIAIVVHIP